MQVSHFDTVIHCKLEASNTLWYSEPKKNTLDFAILGHKYLIIWLLFA